MKENKKIKISRRLFTVIAAAAVLAAATITAGAAANWDFNGAFRSIFSDKGTDAPAESDTAEDSFDFMKYGKELDMWYELEDYKLNIKGISADRTTAYLLYDVVFDEGYDCAPKAEWSDWNLFVYMDALEDGETEAPVSRVNRSHFGLLSQNGNTLSFCGMMGLSDINDTLSGKTITLDFHSLYRMIPTESIKSDEPWIEREELECGVHAEIPVDFEICGNIREFVFDKEIYVYDYENGQRLDVPAVLKSISVTPFSWQMFIETDTSHFVKGDGYSIEFAINLRNGTSITPTNYTAFHTVNGSKYSSIINAPINPEEIESFTISGQTFRAE